MREETDFLVIGSGLAGLTYAIRMAAYGRVSLLTKKSPSDANSSWAQGGIAGAMADNDSFALHIQDTLTAGAGLCDLQAVEVLVCEGPERINDLIALGAHFNMALDEEGNEVLELGREGGHSRNRIVHTADHTGWECEKTLLETALNTPNIVIHQNYFVTDLLIDKERRCVGAAVINADTGERENFTARAVLLATGGCGHVYKHTTNPAVATSDGVAMAWRAGAPIANMEFIQFHPTTLYHPKARAFLITEALRGEGGILRHADGETFMENYHPLKELAPRDIVARAIVSEIKRRNVECVFLDATHIPEEKLRHHFPTILARCAELGIDITKEPIPIAPAQHYQCGGVVTDLNGATEIKGLYAAGEVACTGVHGANRLASNSLLEAMVFAYRAADHTLLQLPELPHIAAQRALPATGEKTGEPVALEEAEKAKREVQNAMQRYVGIVRTTAELQKAKHIVERNLEMLSRPLPPLPAIYEARNIVQTALLIIESALHRHESRGLHFVLDYPEKLESENHNTVLQQ